MKSWTKYVTTGFFLALIYVLSVQLFHTKLQPFPLSQDHEPYHRWETPGTTRTPGTTQSQIRQGVERQDWSVRRQAENRGASSSGHRPSSGVRAPAETAAGSKPDNTSDSRMSGSAQTLSERFPWRVNESSRHPADVHHAAFVKVHKAASTTMFSIVIRFALSRQLNVMFPKKRHILMQSKLILSPLAQHPSSPSFHFDILCNHAIFSHDIFRPYFPSDTKHIAIIRDPFEQVKSAFFYYKYKFHLSYLRSAKSWEHFIENQNRFEQTSPYKSFTNNRMSIDLGLEPRLMKDPAYVTSFVQQLDHLFDLVLIVERLDESLLLLKRRFHWTIKDIVYMNLNTGTKKGTEKGPNATAISGEAMKRFNTFQRFDVAVYQHFVNILEQNVAREGEDFQEELTCYVTIQKQIQDFCSSANSSAAELVLPSSRWEGQLTFSRSECPILTVEEVALNEWARSVQLARLGYS